MRWTGMRISDAHKFTDSEIVRNQKVVLERRFIQKKTKSGVSVRCPGMVECCTVCLTNEGRKKYFFTCTYTALRMRIDTLPSGRKRRRRSRTPLAHIASGTRLRSSTSMWART